MLCDIHVKPLNEKYDCPICIEAVKPLPKLPPLTIEERMEQDGMLAAKDEQFNSVRKY